jgi:hypothetical protein
MVIGAFVRGLSMRDIESLCEQAGLGKLSKTTAQRICTELRERFEAFKRRDLYEVQLAALFLDAVFLSVRPNGPKEGVLVAWGFTEAGERVLLAVMLGMRESHEDWLALGRDLIARGLGAPLLVIAAGAPGLIKGGRAVLARLGPPALRRSPPAQPARQAARTGTRARPAWPTGRRSTTPPTSATASSDSRRWSTNSTVAATPPPPSASPTTSTRWSSTCATRPDTAAGGAARTCSRGRSPRLNAAPR